MPRNQFVDFKAIKAAVTMEQVLQHYGLLDGFKRTGDSLSGPCPIHEGTNPTQFRVSISKNIWNCFSECKHGGNVLDFVAKMEDSTIHAAALKAIEWFHPDLEVISGGSSQGNKSSGEARPSNDVSTRRQLAGAENSENAAPNRALKFRLEKLDQNHPYLIERGLTAETIKEFEVGYCSKGMMKDRVAIPIRNPEGGVVAYAGRWPGDPPEGTPKYKLPQGFRKSLELFNIERAIKEAVESPLVIVEGFFGAMKLYQQGYRKVIALMGSTMSATQEETIRRHIQPNSRVIVMLDEDEAGKFGREDIVVHLSRFAFVRMHVFTEKDKQPEDLTPDEIAAALM
jgi:DNA primase